jgi:hypothetical protein
MTGKGDQTGSVRLGEKDVNVFLEGLMVGVRRRRGAGFFGLDAI